MPCEITGSAILLPTFWAPVFLFRVMPSYVLAGGRRVSIVWRTNHYVCCVCRKFDLHWTEMGTVRTNPFHIFYTSLPVRYWKHWRFLSFAEQVVKPFVRDENHVIVVPLWSSCSPGLNIKSLRSVFRIIPFLFVTWLISCVRFGWLIWPESARLTSANWVRLKRSSASSSRDSWSSWSSGSSCSSNLSITGAR